MVEITIAIDTETLEIHRMIGKETETEGIHIPGHRRLIPPTAILFS